MTNQTTHTGPGIAVVGMAGRFPGAKNSDEFWANLRDGVEALTRFTDDELLAAGVEPGMLLDPAYVKTGTVLDDVDQFDASFFGVSPREAQILDPQHRLFLECAWEALEDAACDPHGYDGAIAVYAGSSMNTYAANQVLQSPKLVAAVGIYQIMLGNDKDFLPTRVSYKLNLRGPSMAIQTACSTSLVAVHLACQALLTYQADVALAGGVSLNFPMGRGYLYQEGMISSPDGHCRPFDAQARGTRAGAGAGIVVLKRLDEALRDRDRIRAVILGAAINNDGADKVGYTAPSVDAQADAVAMALTMANVSPDTIGYVEAHGTATVLGDPIEIAALTKAYRDWTERKQFCAIGSVKGNIGHLDVAAGIAGLIKTVLALEHKQIPASLNYTNPNPQIDFEASPFYVNAALADWAQGATPRRAGVSSFGIGGTNAHVVIEEAPPVASTPLPTGPQLLVVSARTPSALDAGSTDLARRLRERPGLNLRDVAWTLQTGRRAFAHRRAWVCEDRDQAVNGLQGRGGPRAYGGVYDGGTRSVAFMFTGQGSQHRGMAARLYEANAAFRTGFDRCNDILKPHLGLDIREAIFGAETSGSAQRTEVDLSRTELAQPALFALEYALAQMWIHCGVRPAAAIGHSLGEYVAAVIAGVFTLEDALAVVAARGRMVQALPSGRMLAVSLAEHDVTLLLGSGPVSLAAVNAPTLCSVSGPTEAVDELERRLVADGVSVHRLATSHAFHSAMMEPVLDELAERIARVSRRPPSMPWISNVTGTWVTAEDACDPRYWARHLRQPVRFADGIRQLASDHGRVLLEVGPGRVLTTLARETLGASMSERVVQSLPQPRDQADDEHCVLSAAARLWICGVALDWERLHEPVRPRRVSLPTYHFERQRYFVDRPGGERSEPSTANAAVRRAPIDEWFWVPGWRQTPAPGHMARAEGTRSHDVCLVFTAGRLGERMAARLRESGHPVVTVTPGDGFAAHSAEAFTIAPDCRTDYERLLGALRASHRAPERIFHLWNLSEQPVEQRSPRLVEASQKLGFWSLFHLAQALGDLGEDGTMLLVVAANGLYAVLDGDPVYPEKATLLGPARVLPVEQPAISCLVVDVPLPAVDSDEERRAVEWLLAERSTNPAEAIVAYRGGRRWVEAFSRVVLEPTRDDLPAFRPGGTYLITGGLGGLGLAFAEFLTSRYHARLALTTRRAFPAPVEWDRWIHEHDDLDQTSTAVRQIQRLEALGAEIAVFQADVCALDQVMEAVQSTVARFGSLHGVIHAAGLPGGGMIQFRAREAAAAVLGCKVDGTLNMLQVADAARCDFLALCSSVDAIVPVVGDADYCAANSFLDAIARSREGQPGPRVVSINWGTWRDGGMAAAVAVPPGLRAARQVVVEAGIRRDEGAEALCRCVTSGLSQVVASAWNLPDMLRISDELRKALLRNEGTFLADLVPPVSASNEQPRRRTLATPYVPPTTPVQTRLGLIWSELLGIEEIGVNDDLFELGGHSLLATQVLARVQTQLGAKLALRDIFDAPTIARLAERVDKAREASQSRDSMPLRPVSRAARRIQVDADGAPVFPETEPVKDEAR